MAIVHCAGHMSVEQAKLFTLGLFGIAWPLPAQVLKRCREPLKAYFVFTTGSTAGAGEGDSDGTSLLESRLDGVIVRPVYKEAAVEPGKEYLVGRNGGG
jgi:hypothetical protein